MPPWADWLSFALTIIGFAITIWQVSQAKREATVAREAAEAARNAVYRRIASGGLQELVRTLKELRDLRDNDSWPEFDQRYSRARELLIEISGRHPDLDDATRMLFQRYLSTIRLLHEDAAVLVGEERSASGLNSSIADLIDNLKEIEVSLETQKVKHDDGTSSN